MDMVLKLETFCKLLIKEVKKVGFTGETTTGRLILQYASENLIPVTLELGGKSPNIYFKDYNGIGSDDYISRCVERISSRIF